MIASPLYLLERFQNTKLRMQVFGNKALNKKLRSGTPVRSKIGNEFLLPPHTSRWETVSPKQNGKNSLKLHLLLQHPRIFRLRARNCARKTMFRCAPLKMTGPSPSWARYSSVGGGYYD